MQSVQWSRTQRAIAWLLFALFFIAFVLFMVGYTGNSWYVSPVFSRQYPPDSHVVPLSFGLFYMCYQDECKYDLRQDYQIVKLLPQELEITWAYQNYRTACMAIETVAAGILMLTLGSYLVFLSDVPVSVLFGYISAGLQFIAGVMALVGVILFGNQFIGSAKVSPFGSSFALVIVAFILLFVDGVLLTMHTVNVHRHVSARRSKSGSPGLMRYLQDCVQ